MDVFRCILSAVNRLTSWKAAFLRRVLASHSFVNLFFLLLNRVVKKTSLSLLCGFLLLYITTPTAVLADNWYVQGEVGNTTLDSLFSQSAFTSRVSVGWRQNFLPIASDADQWGVELGAQHYTHATNSSFEMSTCRSFWDSYEGSQVDLLGTFRHRLERGLSFFAKVGGAYVNQDLTRKKSAMLGPPIMVSTRGYAFVPELAIGVGYQVTTHIDFLLTTSMLGATPGCRPDNDPVRRTDSVLLGFAYAF